MKIKCPGCASLLQIPDSAAGKVVKCKCGKQLRAPMPKGAAPGAAAPQATPPGGASPGFQSQPLASTPGASPGAAGGSGLFDELTDTDLAPVKAVQVPGAKAAVKPPSASANKLLQEAVSGSDRRGEALAMSGLPPRPGFLTFVGVVNGFWAVVLTGLMLLMFGAIAILPAIEDEIPEEDGAALYLAATILALLALISIATAFACFIRSKGSWYIVLASYSWGFADRVMGIVADAMDDDVEFRIGRAIGGILFGAGVWAYMHGQDVRAFYQTESEPVGKIIAANVAGFVVGGALGAAAIFIG